MLLTRLSYIPANVHDQPEMNVQLLRMPCQVYSGIAPPPALLEAMADRPQSTNSGDIPPPTPVRPSGPNGPASGGVVGRPTQTTDHIEPSPEDIPPDAPPSYEDAVSKYWGVFCPFPKQMPRFCSKIVILTPKSTTDGGSCGAH